MGDRWPRPSTATYTSGYSLTNPGNQNPLTITATGLLSRTSAALYGSPAAAWAVTNVGTIETTALAVTGALYPEAVSFKGGGKVINGQSGSSAGLIKGGWIGVYIHAVGTVVNFGTTESTETVLTAGGVHGPAVDLSDGGSVINGASGSTGALIQSTESGVYTGGDLGCRTPARSAQWSIGARSR